MVPLRRPASRQRHRISARHGLMLASCVAGLLAILGCLPAMAAPDAAEGLHLQEAWQRVDEANADVLSARRNIDSAQADRLTAQVTPPTQFSLLSQAIDPQHFGGNAWQKPVDTIARLDHTIERGGKAALRDGVAQAGVQASQADLQAVRRNQRLATSQAYWDLKLAQEQLKTRVRHAQLAVEGSHIAQLRLQQGDLPRLEATRLAVEAERAQNDLSEAQLKLRQAQQAMALLLHWPERAQTLNAADPWPDASLADTPGRDGTIDPEAWLKARPEVQAAQARLHQAEQALSLAESQRVTDVTVSAQFEHNPAVANRLWGVGLAFPLGVDGRQDGPVRKALIARDEAQAQLERVQQEAMADLVLQQASLDDARGRMQRLDAQLLPQAREAVVSAEYARQQGALGLQDVLDARRALHTAELDSATAHADLARAWSALHTPMPE